MGSHERLASDALNRAFGSSTSASSAYQSGPRALSSCLVRPSVMQGGLLTHLKSDDSICTSEPLRTPPEFPTGLVLSGHSSPSFGSNVALKLRHLSQVERGGSPVRPAREWNGDPECGRLAGVTFIFAAGLIQDHDSRHMFRLWFVFQDGSGVVLQLSLTVLVLSGSTEVFSLRWSYHTIKVALPSNPTPRRSHPDRTSIARDGPAPTWATARVKGTAGALRHAHSLKATFPHRPCERGGFGAGLLPVSLAVTKGIPAVIAIANPQKRFNGSFPCGKGKHTNFSFNGHALAQDIKGDSDRIALPLSAKRRHPSKETPVGMIRRLFVG
ncbi:hypothetical protein JTE90_013627 [Oedothorax gibbosus]|uniref:Uncharacterized protein n=1 Tax=Oedothorax gibbosus TaxID=931172 RepID=A0AAV6TFT9_9ARAC|nr:hypothetical protein JTE90_013627 [Oedothorax gibbosus]